MNRGKSIEKYSRKLLLHVKAILERSGFFDKWSDERYLKFSYWLRMGKKLNLENPQTFNEKLQWLKLHDRKSVYTIMADKYAAKQYVAEMLGEEYIIPTLGYWKRFEDIDFDSLPDQFVLKCTHDSGGLVICRDKAHLDREKAYKKINKSLKTDYYMHGREWPYKDIMPRIIAEAYMENKNERNKEKCACSELIDYKFYCFHGKAEYLYVSQGMENHTTARMNFLTLDWSRAPFGRTDYKEFEELPEKPVCLEKMIQIAEKLSYGIPFLRVDLYLINDQIYFSEFTFTPCNGMMPFKPEEWDGKLGGLISQDK